MECRNVQYDITFNIIKPFNAESPSDDLMVKKPGCKVRYRKTYTFF